MVPMALRLQSLKHFRSKCLVITFLANVKASDMFNTLQQQKIENNHDFTEKKTQTH